MILFKRELICWLTQLNQIKTTVVALSTPKTHNLLLYLSTLEMCAFANMNVLPACLPHTQIQKLQRQKKSFELILFMSVCLMLIYDSYDRCRRIFFFNRCCHRILLNSVCVKSITCQICVKFDEYHFWLKCVFFARYRSFICENKIGKKKKSLIVSNNMH